MSTFSKLSLVAQYDDMCRLVNKLVKESADEEDASIAMLETLEKRWNNREAKHEREKQELKAEISNLKRDIKKLDRHLTECRAALVREADEKKGVARERQALMDQIKQVRQLVESKEGFGNSDAHRRRVIKCLDVDRLSPIQSYDDSDDGASGLDYDRTEEDILDGTNRPSRGSAFEDALESLPANEQPTILCRYLEKNADNENHDTEEPRRTSRRSAAALRLSDRILSNAAVDTATSHRNRDRDRSPTTTESNDMDFDDHEPDIEYVRQQLQKYEAEKREKLGSVNSTPTIKAQNKAATLSARSAAMMKTVSNVSRTPVPNTLKPHSFTRKKSFKPDNCGPCGGKISFYGTVVKCEVCGVVSHPECKDKCPLPCVKITAPNTRSHSKMILIANYVNSDANPKVPALIVHCCNEIEREDNITTSGLYSVVARTSEIEELQQKILKSKSGMPNLTKVDVHLLTGVVKRFLQSLDESLITKSLWSHFSEAIKLDTAIDAQTHMSYYIGENLPIANQHTLAYMMRHLHAIAKHSDKNMMTTKMLAKALAPTIIGNSVRNPTPQTITEESKIQIKIMETLFTIEEEVWESLLAKTATAQTGSLGSRLLGTPSSSSRPRTRASSRIKTLPTPKLKPLFS